MKIIVYTPKYRDDLIFMVLAAKDALGRIPRLNPDLLDIPGRYLKEGDLFRLALDEGKRVIPLRIFSPVKEHRAVSLQILGRRDTKITLRMIHTHIATAIRTRKITWKGYMLAIVGLILTILKRVILLATVYHIPNFQRNAKKSRSKRESLLAPFQ